MTIHWPIGAVVVVAALASACAAAPGGARAQGPRLLLNELVFLTRDGCANTPIMRANVDAAIQSMGLKPVYEMLDQSALSERDARRGYPTPTLLYAGKDLFGMEAATPPFPEPT